MSQTRGSASSLRDILAIKPARVDTVMGRCDFEYSADRLLVAERGGEINLTRHKGAASTGHLSVTVVQHLLSVVWLVLRLSGWTGEQRTKDDHQTGSVAPVRRVLHTTRRLL